MANAEQLERLKRDIRVWNIWRATYPGVPVDLSGADLDGADLSQADLRLADLSRADLPQAVLRGANLQGADLTGAFLFMADLTGANLSGAHLAGAFLWRATLVGATLKGADLTGAGLAQADLRRADLRDADLTGVDLYQADLTQADLSGAEFREARFEMAVEVKGIPIGKGPDEISPPASRGLDEAPPPKESEPTLEEVCFTSIYPKEAQVETWQTLLVYVHLLSAMDALRQDAQRFADQIPSPKELTVAASTRLRRGSELIIIPSCEKVTFNPERLVVKWLEDYQRAEFRFRADASLADDAARGQINIYAGPLLVGTLTFAMLFSKTAPTLAPQHEEHGRLYRQEDIFVSYSHKDTALVLACKKAYEALGFNTLIDVDTLRSGQVWNDELMNMIDRATIFQLFWSQNSSQSKYCRQEWEHALKRNREGFIRPVYWETPLPPPPEELSKYHFEFMEVEAEGPATRGAPPVTRG
jgi:hypothetical protein